jgi:glycerophosphoryl diester phosphodiesterase
VAERLWGFKSPASHPRMTYREALKPRLFGHRGASGVLPENTLPSFALALRSGATHLEMDVHMTRDGHVVVIHDPTVDRTTKGKGDVRAMSLDELRALAPIPTLREVLEAFPRTPLNIEVKQAEPPMIDAFFEVLDAFDARPDVLVAAEVDAIMKSLRATERGVLTGFSTSEVLAFVFEGASPTYRAPGFALQIPETYEGMTLVTSELVERAHRLGVEVHVWTVNDVETAKRLLALGVDGIMSDVPGDLASLFGSPR